MLDTLAEKTCPLCGAKNNVRVVGLGKYTILRCKSCTNAWTYPPCSPQDYENEYFGKDNVASANRKTRRSFTELPKQYQKSLRWLIRTCVEACPPGGRALDIGCGDGLLVEMLIKRGLRCEGIEPSLEATALAIAAGLPVVRGYFPHAAIKGPFDLVVMHHVLEHIADPKQILRLLAALAPNGHLVLAQTNYRGVIPRTWGAKWYGWCPEGHFYHFTPAGLRKLFSELGYKVKFEKPVSAVHTSRRHRYFLPIFDIVPGLADQFIMVAKMPRNGQVLTK